MADIESMQGPIELNSLIRVLFFVGVSFGVMAAPVYFVVSLLEGDIFLGILSFILLPIFSGFHMAIYGFIGYPIYSRISKSGKIGSTQIRARK